MFKIDWKLFWINVTKWMRRSKKFYIITRYFFKTSLYILLQIYSLKFNVCTYLKSKEVMTYTFRNVLEKHPPFLSFVFIYNPFKDKWNHCKHEVYIYVYDRRCALRKISCSNIEEIFAIKVEITEWFGFKKVYYTYK